MFDCKHVLHGEHYFILKVIIQPVVFCRIWSSKQGGSLKCRAWLSWICTKRYLGSRVGAVVRALASHQCVPGSIPGPGVICGLSLLLVLYSAPRGFSPGTPVFPSHQKPTLLNSNSIWKQWMKSHLVEMPLQILIIIIIIIIII